MAFGSGIAGRFSTGPNMPPTAPIAKKTTRPMATDAFDVLEVLVARVEANAGNGAALTLERLRAQLLRDELSRLMQLLGGD